MEHISCITNAQAYYCEITENNLLVLQDWVQIVDCDITVLNGYAMHNPSKNKLKVK